MTVLQHFPMVSQLTPITSDGKPSENAQFDCVAASLCAACMYLLGVPQVTTVWNPDRFKDAAYGDSWRGGTAAVEYIDFCKSLGVDLWKFAGIPGVLVNEAHKQIQAGHPVIFTEPDPYVSAALNWTHVCVFYAEEPGFLTALDPYIAKPIRRSDSEWTQILLENEIWICQLVEEPIVIDLTTPGVNVFFEAVPGNPQQWRRKDNGKIIQYGILNFYRQFGNSALCGLTWLGLPVSNEIPLGGNVVKQHFENAVLVYDPTHPNMRPGYTGSVYLLPLYDGGPGEDPMIADLKNQLVQAQQTAQSSASLGAIKQIQAIVRPF